jgi:hypothetical protein
VRRGACFVVRGAGGLEGGKVGRLKLTMDHGRWTVQEGIGRAVNWEIAAINEIASILQRAQDFAMTQEEVVCG